MIPRTDARLAIAAVFLSLIGLIFFLEFVALAGWFLRRKRERRRSVIRFRHLVAPVAVGVLLIIFIIVVFTGKRAEMISTSVAIHQCDNIEVDADVGGDGIRIAVCAQESVLISIIMLGTFHYSTTGAKEIGAGLAITHVSLAIAIVVQEGRGTLRSAEAILGAIILDSQNSALSVHLMAKETLASQWQVAVVLLCQAFSLAILAHHCRPIQPRYVLQRGLRVHHSLLVGMAERMLGLFPLVS